MQITRIILLAAAVFFFVSSILSSISAPRVYTIDSSIYLADPTEINTEILLDTIKTLDDNKKKFHDLHNSSKESILLSLFCLFSAMLSYCRELTKTKSELMKIKSESPY